jgi:hypothetical protein
MGYNMPKLSVVHAATISLCPSTLQSLRYICYHHIKKGTKVSVTGLTDVAVETNQLHTRKSVAAVCDNNWGIGCITAHNECGILVKFMERKGQDILTLE